MPVFARQGKPPTYLDYLELDDPLARQEPLLDGSVGGACLRSAPFQPLFPDHWAIRSEL